LPASVLQNTRLRYHKAPIDEGGEFIGE